jgi:polyhydroxybutyrate depolymerase
MRTLRTLATLTLLLGAAAACQRASARRERWQAMRAERQRAPTLASRDGPKQQTGDIAITMPWAGRTRSAILVIPPGPAPASGWPAVMVLHGGGGTALQTLSSNGWRTVAARERFVLIAPNGTPSDESAAPNFPRNPQTWNAGPTSGLANDARSASAKRVDDVGFLAALLDTVGARARVDRGRVCVAGHSNGAGMTYRFASSRPERVAAIGVMAGHLSTDAPASLSADVPLVHIVGDTDPLVPMNGGETRITRRGPSVDLRPALDGPARWAQMHGITTPARIIRDDSLTVREWSRAGSGPLVTSYVVKGSGHSWLYPGGGDRLPAALVGPRRDALNATDVMWKFFTAHSR